MKNCEAEVRTPIRHKSTNFKSDWGRASNVPQGDVVVISQELDLATKERGKEWGMVLTTLAEEEKGREKKRQLNSSTPL